VAQLPFVSFLSDYGLDDEFVGVCKGVLLSLAPHVGIIDITHGVAPHDVRAGALALVRAVQYLPTGVVLAIVDPGVGSARRAVAVEVEDGYLVGPDNGLLAPAVAIVGGATRAVSLTSEAHQLAAPGPTFAGRDVMAPAAAYLADGVPLDQLGEAISPASLMPGVVPLPSEDGDAITGEVWWVDRFGNCQLNIGPDELLTKGTGPGASLELRFGTEARMARWVGTYSDARPSELVVLTDSYGLLSIALDRASAADACGLKTGSAVTVVPGPSAPPRNPSGASGAGGQRRPANGD
jgi:S-adenosyl-L-methionine hydrolase (adenosine-forming)